MVKGKQIVSLSGATITQAEVNAGAAGTLAGFMKTTLTGTDKIVTFPAIVATANGVKASNSALTEVPKMMPQANVNGGDAAPLVGDGTKVNVAFYFSTDGVAAKTFATLAVGDFLYVNTTGAGGLGYPLDATDYILLSYRA